MCMYAQLPSALLFWSWRSMKTETRLLSGLKPARSSWDMRRGFGISLGSWGESQMNSDSSALEKPLLCRAGAADGWRAGAPGASRASPSTQHCCAQDRSWTKGWATQIPAFPAMLWKIITINWTGWGSLNQMGLFFSFSITRSQSAHTHLPLWSQPTATYSQELKEKRKPEITASWTLFFLIIIIIEHLQANIASGS